MAENPTHGAGRVVDHAVLGPLSPAEPARITVDGRPIEARVGEPVAVALLAAGIHICRTMPGSDEPRGPFCMIGRCTDCLMEVDGAPNVRTCLTPVRDGMRVATQHGLGAVPEVAS